MSRIPVAVVIPLPCAEGEAAVRCLGAYWSVRRMEGTHLEAGALQACRCVVLVGPLRGELLTELSPRPSRPPLVWVQLVGAPGPVADALSLIGVVPAADLLRRLPSLVAVGVIDDLLIRAGRAAVTAKVLSPYDRLRTIVGRVLGPSPVWSVQGAGRLEGVRRSPDWVTKTWARMAAASPHPVPPLSELQRCRQFLEGLRARLAEPNGTNRWAAAKLHVRPSTLRSHYIRFTGRLPRDMTMHEVARALHRIETHIFGWLLKESEHTPLEAENGESHG